jgi:hypothetical protein
MWYGSDVSKSHRENGKHCTNRSRIERRVK